MKLKVFRYDPGNDKNRYNIFDVETQPGMTVLGALFYIRERLDDSLSFRYSCRGAVCGTCAVLINKVPRLACRTQIDKLAEGRLAIELKPYPVIEITEPWDPKKEVLVEPLPHLPILKDLLKEYLGPAALAKLYRFYLDPREGQEDSRLDIANYKSGWWGCEFHTNCKRVCPKGVIPNRAIGRVRQRLKEINMVPKEIKKKGSEKNG